MGIDGTQVLCSMFNFWPKMGKHYILIAKTKGRVIKYYPAP